MLGLIVGETAKVPTPQIVIVSVPISSGCAKAAILHGCPEDRPKELRFQVGRVARKYFG